MIVADPLIPVQVTLLFILDGNGWYDSNRMELLYKYYKKLVDTRGMLKKAVFNAERMNLNKEIKKAIQTLDDANAT